MLRQAGRVGISDPSGETSALWPTAAKKEAQCPTTACVDSRYRRRQSLQGQTTYKAAWPPYTSVIADRRLDVTRTTPAGVFCPLN
jgi:hypothetical protein